MKNKNFFIHVETYGNNKPRIIDEKTLYKAERGRNDLDPDDYTFLCAAENKREAQAKYKELIRAGYIPVY